MKKSQTGKMFVVAPRKGLVSFRPSIWHVLIKQFDLGEPTSLLDQVCLEVLKARMQGIFENCASEQRLARICLSQQVLSNNCVTGWDPTQMPFPRHVTWKGMRNMRSKILRICEQETSSNYIKSQMKNWKPLENCQECVHTSS